MAIAIYSNVLDNGGISKFVYNMQNAFEKKNIKSAAKVYICLKDLYSYDIRFDVIEIYLKKDKYKLSHLKNVDINY